MKDTDKVSGNQAGEDIGAPIGLGTAGDTGTTGALGGDITADVSKYSNPNFLAWINCHVLA